MLADSCQKVAKYFFISETDAQIRNVKRPKTGHYRVIVLCRER